MGEGPTRCPLTLSAVEALHATFAHIQYILLRSSFKASPHQSHVGQKARLRAQPRRKVRVEANIPTMPSVVMPCYDTHNCPSANLDKILTKQQTILSDHALCLSDSYLACILKKSQITYKSILEFNNCQRSACMAAVEERKELPAHGLLLTLDHLVRSRKVYS